VAPFSPWDYRRPSISVKQETPSLVASEMERIKNDAKLKGLIQE